MDDQSRCTMPWKHVPGQRDDSEGLWLAILTRKPERSDSDEGFRLQETLDLGRKHIVEV